MGFRPVPVRCFGGSASGFRLASVRDFLCSGGRRRQDFGQASREAAAGVPGRKLDRKAQELVLRKKNALQNVAERDDRRRGRRGWREGEGSGPCTKSHRNSTLLPRCSLHETESEFPGRMHEIKSELAESRRGEAHEMKSEFATGLHEITSECGGER